METRAKRGVAILQPGYLPWLGYFEQMARVDLFLALDDVDYTKQDWRNRNRIRTNAPAGWSWLTVPVDAATTHGKLDAVVVRPYREWWPKHLRQLDEHYGRRGAPFYARVRDELQAGIAGEPAHLVDLDLELAGRLERLFGLDTPVVRTSSLADRVAELGGRAPGDKNARLIALCRAVGATYFYDGKAAGEFLEMSRFHAEGIEVELQDYHHPTYPQSYPGFVSHLAAVDALSWLGPEAGATCLRAADRDGHLASRQPVW